MFWFTALSSKIAIKAYAMLWKRTKFFQKCLNNVILWWKVCKNNSVNSIFPLVSAIKCTLINFKVKYVLKFTMISQKKDFFNNYFSYLHWKNIQIKCIYSQYQWQTFVTNFLGVIYFLGLISTRYLSWESASDRPSCR